MKTMRKMLALMTAALLLASLPLGAMAEAHREVPSEGFTLPQMLQRPDASDEPEIPDITATPEAAPSPTAEPAPEVTPEADAPDAALSPTAPNMPVVTPQPDSWQGNAADGLSFGVPMIPAVSEEKADATVAPEPETTVVPEAAADPETTAEPEVTFGPETTAEPETAAEPEDTEETETTAEPEVTPEPEATMEPEITAEPETAIEPEATVEPEVTPEPTPEPEWGGDADNGLSFAPTSVQVSRVEDMLNPERSIDIYAEWADEVLTYGSEMTLRAVLSGFDGAVYAIQWQTSSDNATWSDVPGAVGSSYTFTVTEENADSFWRVELTVTDVIDG